MTTALWTVARPVPLFARCVVRLAAARARWRPTLQSFAITLRTLRRAMTRLSACIASGVLRARFADVALLPTRIASSRICEATNVAATQFQRQPEENCAFGASLLLLLLLLSSALHLPPDHESTTISLRVSGAFFDCVARHSSNLLSASAFASLST